MPSFVTGKRFKLTSLAAAGTLSVAGLVTALVVALPSTASASAPSAAANLTVATQHLNAELSQAANKQGAMNAAQQINEFDHVRFGLGMRQHAYEQDQAAAKAAATKAAAAKAKAEVAAKKAQAAAAAQRKAAASGSPKQVAQAMLSQFGWSASQFSCLNPLWWHESGWNLKASNPGSGAYGIPQALPGSRMASAGPDWQTNAATQIRWGLKYIQSTYGSPCAAWSHEQSSNWY
jgi:hypothetical protein